MILYTGLEDSLEALLNSLKVLQDHSNSKDDKELYKRLVKSLEDKEKIDEELTDYSIDNFITFC